MNDGVPGPGNTIASYEILDEIGRGGLGVVYRGRHVHLGRIVALKLLHPYWTASQEFTKRFREEGRVMALLEHPNILRVYDAGEVDNVFFLAMRYLEGQTLEDAQREPVSQERAISVTRQLADALAYAHGMGVVHRDVKPANIVVGPKGEATLMDFGVARLKDAPGMTLPGVQVGTPFYMAPEQITGKAVDGRADIYALGVVLYQMLAGQLPFPGPDTEPVFHGHIYQEPPPLTEECPEWLRRVVAKSLAKSPDDRFADAEQMRLALESGGNPELLAAAGVTADTPLSAAAASQAAAHPGPASTADQTTLMKRERTALALDVVGSSRMKRPGLTMAVQHQFALFRDYVRTHLEEHGCLACSWAGDGLLALFARPRDGVAAAVAVIEGLHRFNASLPGGGDQIRIRAGVHDGSILMSDDQPIGEITSSTLDVAGHLQKSCPENSLLISESTYRSLTETTGWEPAGPDPIFETPTYRYSPHGAAGGSGEGAELGSYSPGHGGPPDELLLQVTGPQGRREHSIRGEVLIGRGDPSASSESQICLADEAVSRRHARIYIAEEGFWIEDLGSTNGTMLNGRWLHAQEPAPLKPGDKVDVGESTVLRVQAPVVETEGGGDSVPAEGGAAATP